MYEKIKLIERLKKQIVELNYYTYSPMDSTCSDLYKMTTSQIKDKFFSIKLLLEDLLSVIEKLSKLDEKEKENDDA